MVDFDFGGFQPHGVTGEAATSFLFEIIAKIFRGESVEALAREHGMRQFLNRLFLKTRYAGMNHGCNP